MKRKVLVCMSYLASYIVGLVFQVIYGLIKVKIEIAWPLYVTILMTVKTPEKKIINFILLSSPHTGLNIAQVIYDKLILWNFDKKVFCLVLDNSSANDACIKALLNTPIKK
jgi:hypothetical protein